MLGQTSRLSPLHQSQERSSHKRMSGNWLLFSFKETVHLTVNTLSM